MGQDVVIDRWQAKTVKTLMGERRVLLLAGPRQCGKTTLAQQLAGDAAEYRTLDDALHRTLAANDPAGFVRHSQATLIIDEIQRVPALLPAIKLAVDEDQRPGRFLLTGSTNLQALPTVQESLAGRIAKIRLRPFAAGELHGCQPDFIARCFAQDWGGYHRAPSPPAEGGVTREALIDAAVRGGFPEAVGLKERARRRWHRDYIGALLERDLQDIAQIRRREAMRDLVKTLAAWSGKHWDAAKIGAKLAIQRPTLDSYLNMVEALFLIERVPAWTKGDYGRVGKRKKLFMTDSGLMASILRLRPERAQLGPDQAGKLIETYVHNQLAAQVDAADGDYALYHYRDREGREIDFIIERDDGALLCIEVKSAAVVHKDDLKHILWFRDRIAGKRQCLGIVLYAGPITGRMGEGLWAVSALQEFLAP